MSGQVPVVIENNRASTNVSQGLQRLSFGNFACKEELDNFLKMPGSFLLFPESEIGVSGVYKIHTGREGSDELNTELSFGDVPFTNPSVSWADVGCTRYVAYYVLVPDASCLDKIKSPCVKDRYNLIMRRTFWAETGRPGRITFFGKYPVHVSNKTGLPLYLNGAKIFGYPASQAVANGDILRLGEDFTFKYWENPQHSSLIL